MDVMRQLWWYVNFITVNISSPNTKDLRNLQAVQFLLELLQAVQEENYALERHHGSLAKPLGFKISPDETDEQLADMVSAARAARVSFIILTNTTIKRDRTDGWNIPADRGGVSGKPLAPAAMRVLQRVASELRGAIPLIAVGGISNGDELYQRILNGASLCQAYTAWPFEGPDFVKRCLRTLVRRLESDGFYNVQAAVGAKL